MRAISGNRYKRLRASTYVVGFSYMDMEKLKQYKYIILIAVLLLGFVFYWLEIRPSQIIKKCIADYPNAFKTYDNSKSGGIKPFDYDFIDENKSGYQKCLREHGLKI